MQGFVAIPGPAYWGAIGVCTVIGVFLVCVASGRRLSSGRSARRWLLDAEAAGIYEPASVEPETVRAQLFPALIFLLLGFFVLFQTARMAWASALAVSLLLTMLSLGLAFACLSCVNPNRTQPGASLGFAALSLGWFSFGLVCWRLLMCPSQVSTTGFLTLMALLLAVGSWWWHWLGRVWRQQLDGEQIWTVAGALIPMSRRFALIFHALGMGIATFLVVSSSPVHGDSRESPIGMGLVLAWVVLFLSAVGYRMTMAGAMGRAWPLLTFLVFLGAVLLRLTGTTGR